MWLLLMSLGCDRQTCSDVDALPDEGDVLTLGDSSLAWHAPRCRSVPDYLAMARGAAVENRAVNGARVMGGTDPIPEQYVEGEWDWVVVAGGGNDLNYNCGCTGDCEWVLDRLIDPEDWRGATPVLAEKVLQYGGQVALVGYYTIPEQGWYGLGECGEELEELNARYEAYAELVEGVTFVDFGAVVDWEDGEGRKAYDFDKVHPDPAGAEALGNLLADVIDPQ